MTEDKQILKKPIFDFNSSDVLSKFHCACGYIVEQAYSGALEAFYDRKKGYKNYFGKYYPKNTKKHKRVRRKLNIKNIEVNPIWVFYV